MKFASAIVEKLREKADRYASLFEEISKPEVASNPKRCTEISKELSLLRPASELARRLEELQQRRSEAEDILADAGADPDLNALAREELEVLPEEEEAFDREVKSALIRREEDSKSKVIVEVRAGTGGDEATLFAADLYRIYKRYFDLRGWRVELLSVSPTDLGGFKEITFAVEGQSAWSKLRHESGGHRVQRVPKTEAQGRIHTSAATVAVLPEAEEVEVEIKNDDLRIDTMRAGGAGGQHVNKTESAVRITHLPTGTVVQCQDEKSQFKNKARAMRILRSRILEEEVRRQHAARAAARKEQVGTGDRNARIRTYNWPQNRVSDHRLGQNFSLESVLAGKLDPILDGLEELNRVERIRTL